MIIFDPEDYSFNFCRGDFFDFKLVVFNFNQCSFGGDFLFQINDQSTECFIKFVFGQVDIIILVDVVNLQSGRKLEQALINLFFENSTRTSTSFELAGKRLGGDVINMSVGTSSIKKGDNYDYVYNYNCLS